MPRQFTYGSRSAAVTPSNTVNLVSPNGQASPALIYVGGTGNVVIETAGGDIVTFNAVPVGTILPVLVIKVTTASTATLMTAIWV